MSNIPFRILTLLFLLFQFSSIFTECPVKLRVVIDTPRSNTVLVRQYQIETVDTIVEIKSNGDIWCDDILALAAKNGTVLEFNSKDGQTYSETFNPNFLPRTFDVSSNAASTKFWTKEKVVQNALLCCQVIIKFPMIFKIKFGLFEKHIKFEKKKSIYDFDKSADLLSKRQYL